MKKKSSVIVIGLLAILLFSLTIVSFASTDDAVITAALIENTSDSKTIAELLKEWGKENDVEIEIALYTDSATEHMMTAWNAGSEKFDIVQSSDIETLSDAGFLIPLDGSYDSDIKLTEEMKKQFYDGVIQNSTYKDKIWSVYYSTDADPFYFNKELLAEEGYEDAPENYDELVEMAKNLTKDLDGDGIIDQWGFATWLKPQTNGNFGKFLGFLYREGGELYSDGEFKFDSEAGVRALTVIKDLIRKHEVTPEAALSWYQDETFTAIQNEKLAMAQAANWMYNALNEEGSPVEGLIEMAPMPKGSERGGSRLAGNAVVLAKKSKNPKLAWEAMKYLVSYDSQVYMMKQGADWSGRRDVYQSPEAIANNPEASKKYGENLEESFAISRAPYYNIVEKIVGKHIDKALHEVVSPEEALKDAHEEIKRTLEL